MIVNMKKAGIFIFEGIDNVGKTTVIKSVKERLQNEFGVECVVIAFPGNEEHTLGKMVYDIHHQKKYFKEKMNEISLQLLHIAAHIDLIERKIKALLPKENIIILLDRFWWSTYVYGLASNINKRMVNAIVEPERIYWEKINIDKIFLLERENRLHDYSEEKEKIIVEQYRNMALKYENTIIMENDGELNTITTQIVNYILENGI